MLVDGDRVAEASLHAHEATHYGTDTTAVMEAKMPAGRHVLTLVFFGVFNVANMVIEKIADDSRDYVWTGEGGDGDWTNPVNWGRGYGWDYPYFGEPANFTNVSFAVCGGMGTVSLAPAGVATGTVFRLSASDWLFTNVVAVLLGGVQACGDTLRLAAGSRLEVETTNVPIGALRVEKGASVVFPGGKACLRADQVSVAGVVTAEGPLADMEHTNRVWIACRDFTLELSGAVDLKGKGWAGGRYVAGQGQTPGVGPGASSASAGAGHGGLGSMTRVGSSVGRIYDDPLAPSLPGSGAYTANGSGGGGAVRIDATGAVRIDGAIDASAASGGGACGSSGGSVWISAASVAGSGSVRADAC